MPYYRGLRVATGSPILRLICTRILEDEANHLKFQASMLARAAFRRPAALQRALSELHRLFLLGTIFVVWMEHRPVFQVAGYNFGQFKNETLLEFSDWKIARGALRKQVAARQKPMIKDFGRVEPET